MLKATLFVWCLLLATSSYNAQFTIESPNYQQYNPYSQLNYPINHPLPYYQPFYHPMYQQQYNGPDYGKDYDSSFYFREPDLGLINVTSIGKQSEHNIAGRTKLGNQHNQPDDSPVGITSNLQRIGGRPQKPTRPIIDRPRPGAKPTEGKPDADNKQRPTPFLNWLRQILLRWIAFLARLFPNLYTTVYSTQTFTEVSTCTISTTACASRRRRAVINDLIEHTSDEQLERELSSNIKPESESSVAGMKLLDKRQVNPRLHLDSLQSKDLDTLADVEGSLSNPEDQEEIKNFRKQIKMSPLKAAQLAKQLGFNTITIVTSTTITTTTQLRPPCSTPGPISQC